MSLRNRLSAELPFSRGELASLIHSAPFAYKEYRIRKANGGWREVSQPTPAVKLIQRFVVTRELQNFPVHPAATAYRQDVGLAENLKPHLKNRFLLKMDFKNFFPSLRPTDLELLLTRSNLLSSLYSDQDYRDLVRILFKATPHEGNLRLAIGAPSSPHLSNILLYALDVTIQDLCNKRGITYTRYADDLAFSTSQANILRTHEDLIHEIISTCDSPKLAINPDKTVHTSVKRGRHITGLTISNNGNISIGRERKRRLRAEIHAYQQGKFSFEEHQSLCGYISFLNSVQPNEIESLRAKYGTDFINELLFTRERQKAA